MNAPIKGVATAARAEPAAFSISTGEFIGLVAMMMALTALSIDIMLPALPAIGDALGVAVPNDRQSVIIVYMLGFAAGQLFYGRLSDRYGRRPVLLTGLTIFIAGSLVATVAPGFAVLLAARAAQGLGAAAPRVIAIAVVRDRYAGREMARVMSLAMAIFIIIPVLAPSLGQGLLSFGSWRLIFDALLIAGIVLAIWAGLRLPETLRHAPGAESLRLGKAIGRALTTPQTIGYALGGGLAFGCVLGYVSSAQQVFVDVFHLGALFPLAFGATALMIALASLTNAMLVERLGMRRLSHAALLGFVAISLALFLATLAGLANVWLFLGLMAPLFFLFGLIAPNFNALAMEPQGDNAGMASSVIGFVSTAVGAIGGGIVGHLFDGTVMPLVLGFLLLGVLALGIVVWIAGLRDLLHPAPHD